MNPYVQHIVKNKFGVQGTLREHQCNPYHVTLRGLEQIFYTTRHQTKFGVANVAHMDVELVSWFALINST